MFNTRNGFVLLEATEDGYIELARGNYKEIKALEQQYREPDNGVYVYTEIVRNGKTRYSANDSFIENIGKYEQGSRQTRGKRLQTDTTGNNENLRRGNKGQQSVKFSLPEHIDDSYDRIFELQYEVGRLNREIQELENRVYLAFRGKVHRR